MTLISNPRHVPRVSILMPSYNHAAFVRHAVESALNQTFQDFEIILIDDASSDDSRQALSQISDPRVFSTFLEKNIGGAATLNLCITKARGEFLAVLNSDDVWEPKKLEKQLSILTQNSTHGAVFSRASFIDEHGKPLSGLNKFRFSNIFSATNGSQGQLLGQLYRRGNSLCHPSVLIRRSCYAAVGFYNNSLRQLPDFDFWIRLLKHTSIYILDEELVRFRILPHEANASAPSAANRLRTLNENFLIYRTFLDGLTAPQLREAFPGASSGDVALVDDLDHSCAAALILLRETSAQPALSQLVALEKLGTLLAEPSQAERLQTKFKWTAHDFQKLTQTMAALSTPTSAEAMPLAELCRYTWERLKKALLNRLS